MTRCILSAIRRYSPATEPSGCIYVIDPEEQKILHRSVMIDPPYRHLDPNPRGGLRGSKGIAVRPDQIALANASAIFRYDPYWNLLGVITHPACGCIHDILFQDDSLWVSSAQTDLLLQFDLDGKLRRYYNVRELSTAVQALEWQSPPALDARQVQAGAIDFRDPSSHEKAIYNRAHVNSACFLPDGSMLVSLGFVIQGQFANLLRWKTRLIRWGVWPALMSFNRQMRAVLGLKKDMHSDLVVSPKGARSAIVQILPDGDSALRLVIPDVTAPSHSLLLLPDQSMIYLHTTRGELINFNPLSGETIFTLKVTDGFLRGAVLLSQRTLLLGSNGELITVDLADRRVLARMSLSNDPKESIYDIQVLPPHYNLPPESFDEHFYQTAGFKAEDIILKGARAVFKPG